MKKAEDRRYKDLENALKEKEARLDAIMKAFDGLMYACSSDYRIEFMNDKSIRRTGHNAIGEVCYKAMHGLDSPCQWCVNERVLKGETVRWEVKSPKDDRWYYVVNTPVCNPDGTVSKQSIGFDITDQKMAEDALKESHERLLAVLDSLDAIVYVADMKSYEVLFVNKYLRDMLGDVGGRRCWQYFQPDQNAPCHFCTNDKLLTPEGEPAGVYGWEFQNTATGKWYDIRDRAVRWIDGRIVRLEIALDITEQKKNQEKRQRIRNLEAIGRLAAGVAHEINNPLANASLNTQILKNALKGSSVDSSILSRLDMLERNIERASAIAKELLHFSRQKKDEYVQVNVNDVVATVLSLMDYKLIDIKVNQNLSKLPEIDGDPAKLEQVFINILNNAIDSMPNGGEITVSTLCEGGQVQVEIEDTGSGIPDELKQKVFEPFFTTKDIGAGTGLGLSTSYAIISQHKGAIDITSTVGRGTSVKVKIPLMEKI